MAEPKSKTAVKSEPVTRNHKAAEGDTVHSIALQYELDARTVARLNGTQIDHKFQPGEIVALGALWLDSGWTISAKEASSVFEKGATVPLAWLAVLQHELLIEGILPGAAVTGGTNVLTPMAYGFWKQAIGIEGGHLVDFDSLHALAERRNAFIATH